MLLEIGQKHNKNAAQVALRFLVQNGIIAIPKSTHSERMRQNFAIFDFALNKEEMRRLEALDTNVGFSVPSSDFRRVEYLLGI